MQICLARFRHASPPQPTAPQRVSTQARSRKADSARLDTGEPSTTLAGGRSPVIVAARSSHPHPPRARSTRLSSFVWLHGFASGPTSSKGRFVQQRLLERGAALQIPDLNLPSFRELTVSRMLGEVDRLAGESAVLFGSSLGGLTAALWAARNPGRCAALVLLAPAFDLGRRWVERMGRGGVE